MWKARSVTLTSSQFLHSFFKNGITLTSLRGWSTRELQMVMAHSDKGPSEGKWWKQGIKGQFFWKKQRNKILAPPPPPLHLGVLHNFLLSGAIISEKYLEGDSDGCYLRRFDYVTALRHIMLRKSALWLPRDRCSRVKRVKVIVSMTSC